MTDTHTSKPHTNHEDMLEIGSLKLSSRLFLGTSQYPDLETLKQSILGSQTELVTVAIRRVDIKNDNEFSLIGMLKKNQIHLLPNTAGCYTAKEAILTAHLSRESLKTNLIKLEVIGDEYTLYPDSVELLNAAERLVKDGFEVFPYCSDDIVLCQRLADMGCVCVMPLGSPIGSGRGIQNAYNISLIKNKVSVPVVVDAGIGTASDACHAMELGADAVLINSAIAKAGYPVKMARAMSDAIHAGRQAYHAKRITIKDHAEASTKDDGKIQYYNMKR